MASQRLLPFFREKKSSIGLSFYFLSKKIFISFPSLLRRVPSLNLLVISHPQKPRDIYITQYIIACNESCNFLNATLFFTELWVFLSAQFHFSCLREFLYLGHAMIRFDTLISKGEKAGILGTRELATPTIKQMTREDVKNDVDDISLGQKFTDVLIILISLL